MPDLILDDVPEEVVEALARRAAEHGRTVETEHLIILEEALGLKGAAFWRRRGAARGNARPHPDPV